MGRRDDARALAAALRARVRGEVRFDATSRALYATDASNYRQVPIGVVVPRDRDDAIAAIETCRDQGAPLLARGGGTSLAGQCCNVAVVLDFSKHLNRLLAIDPEAATARVEPGLVLDRLQEAARPHGLMFGPDPATHAQCTLGGMIGNDSCGVHSILAGRTSDNVEELDVVTGDAVLLRAGRLAPAAASGGREADVQRRLAALAARHGAAIRARFPDIPRRVSGYGLDRLLPERGASVARALVGSEGTCVTVLAATVRLIPRPPARALLLLGYEDVFAAADHVLDVLATRPIGLEGLDDQLVSRMAQQRAHAAGRALLPEGSGWLIAEYAGDGEPEARAQAEAARVRLGAGPGAPRTRVLADPRAQAAVWGARESALGATVFVPGARDTQVGFEDAAVPPARLGAYLRELKRLLDAHGYGGVIYGHFGDGCLHVRLDFDLRSAAGRVRFRRFLEAGADLVVSFGGSLSGEHGDGQARGALLPRMFGAELMEAFREFKRIWDPEGRMNPGKLVDARGVADDLRHRPEPSPLAIPTHFAYPADDSSFERATERCIGIGRCRRAAGEGVMCPSFAATGEEMHSTRGRARLLSEMVRGEVVKGGWQDEGVKEALDLCLSCKGCKSDCPTGVDIATYKAEFLAHYYRGRPRPARAWALGRVASWAPLAALAPGLANLVTRTPASALAVKRLAGIAPDRSLPAFAPETFRRWFRRRRRSAAGGAARRRVLLWPDTFTEHFAPAVGRAAVSVLERAGFAVELPARRLCCGRPLYDWGWLEEARAALGLVLDTLRPVLREDVPIVVLEPSCASVFRDELPGLFPHDADARRLASGSRLLGELLAGEAADVTWALPAGKAIAQVHCHQSSAVLDGAASRDWLGRLGADLSFPEPGCCGMAGGFGLAREHAGLSRRIGERALLPAVRSAPAGTLVLADGFSCREQIRQGTSRRALHLAEALAGPGEIL